MIEKSTLIAALIRLCITLLLSNFLYAATLSRTTTKWADAAERSFFQFIALLIFYYNYLR